MKIKIEIGRNCVFDCKQTVYLRIESTSFLEVLQGFGKTVESFEFFLGKFDEMINYFINFKNFRRSFQFSEDLRKNKRIFKLFQ